MTTREHSTRPEGHVVVSLVGPDGQSHKIVDRHNLTTYAAADAVAMAYAGDSSYIPSKIAFIYGTSGDLVIDSVDKTTTWSDIEKACADSPNLGFEITGFSYAPTVGSSDDEKYEHNKVTFHCRTTDGIPAGSFIYRACLLGKGTNGASYNLLAAIDLDSEGVFRAKPESFELSIDWSVKFN